MDIIDHHSVIVLKFLPPAFPPQHAPATWPCCPQDMEELTEQGWTYPRQGSSSPLSLWTSSHLEMADWSLGRFGDDNKATQISMAGNGRNELWMNFEWALNELWMKRHFQTKWTLCESKIAVLLFARVSQGVSSGRIWGHLEFGTGTHWHLACGSELSPGRKVSLWWWAFSARWLACWAFPESFQQDHQAGYSRIKLIQLARSRSILKWCIRTLQISVKTHHDNSTIRTWPGNPNPDATVDYDRELITVGWVDIILGFAGYRWILGKSWNLHRQFQHAFARYVHSDWSDVSFIRQKTVECLTVTCNNL